MAVQDDLRRSMNEESVAAEAYRRRARYARIKEDEVTAKLWEHVAEEEDGHYNEFKDRLLALQERLPSFEGWVYAKVGATEVRGRRVPSGIEVEQISPTYDQVDFDRAVKSIEGRLRGAEVSHISPGVGKRPFPKTYGDWVDLAEDIKAKDKSPETSSQANMMLNTIISEAREPGREPPGDVDAARRWLVDKAGELGIS